MKKNIKLVSLLLALVFVLVGCAKKDNNLSENIDNVENNKLNVYATVYPIYDFAKNIGGNKVDVKLIIPNGQEPHDYESSNKTIQDLEKADVFIYNGAGLESWSEKIIKSSNNNDLVIVEASNGVEILNETADGKKIRDPHVWLDPKNALIESRNIKDAFIEKDPENKEYYESNFNEYANKLEELDGNFNEKLSNLENNTIIVSHEAFGYLCNAYNLNQIGIEGVNAESEPDAKTMARIVDLVRSEDIKVIFTEDIVDPKVAATIANEARIKTEFLNPLESLTEDEIENNDDYISIMQSNLIKLEEALK